MLNQVQYDIPCFLKQRRRETSWESLRENGEALNEVKSYKYLICQILKRFVRFDYVDCKAILPVRALLTPETGICP